MTAASGREGKYERAARKALQAYARLERLQAQVRVREKKREVTRLYRLGLVLESFVFDEPELLARVEALIQLESPRVRAAFGLDRPPSWFEQPQHEDDKKSVNTRRFRLGMVLERLVSKDDQLIARLEVLMEGQMSLVRSAFGLDDEGPSWFDKIRDGTIA